DLRAGGLTRPPPPDFADWRVTRDDPDIALPWPDAAGLERWWREHQARFPPHATYLAGPPRDRATLEHALRPGPQRHRAIAAFLIGRATPHAAFASLAAPAWQQARELAQNTPL